jgi:iron complex outermembrane recepter protein
MRSCLKTALLSGTCLMLGFASSALAQVPTKPADITVGEVVVTGQKRESTVQNTAAAINVISAETLAATGTTGTTNLQFVTPGLVISQDLGLQTQIFIRGIGSNLQGIGTGNSVSTYIDGAFIPNSISSSQQFTDVERVEVLKGPQATLYGRNATGGAISIVTAEPSFQYGGSADVSFGNYNAKAGHFRVSLPIIEDRLALSVAGQLSQHDGYVENLFTGRDLNYEKIKGIRVGLKAIVTDDLTVVLRADYTDILESDVYKARPSTSYYYLTPPNTLANQSFGPQFYAPDPRQVYYDVDNRNPGYDRGISANINWKTPIGTITSVTSKRLFDAGPIIADNDQTPLYTVVLGTKINTIGSRQESESFYHDTYLSTDFQGRLNFIVGGNYFHDQSFQLDKQTTTQNRAESKTDAWSAYVDGNYDITDTIRLVAGVRYSDEKKKFEQQAQIPVLRALVTNSRKFTSTNPRIGLEWRPQDGLLIYATATSGFKSGGFNQSNAVNSFNPEKIWSYEGGVKARLWGGRARIASSAFYYDYKDIQVLQYVLAPLPGQTLATLNQVVSNAGSATVYGLDTDGDVAVNENLTIGGGISLLHSEFGSALFCNPMVGTCAPAAGSGVQAKFVNVKGNPLARAPAVTGNIYGEYKVPLSIPGELKLRLNAAYRSKTYFTVFKADEYAVDPYWLLSGSVRYTSDTDWYVEVYGNNLTDKLAITNIINSSPSFSGTTGLLVAGTPARFERYVAPRTYGVRLGFSF